jgi:hypothetical protein
VFGAEYRWAHARSPGRDLGIQRDVIGTPARPFYFLHIPKTAGSSINRLIDDSFGVDAIYPAYLPSVGCDLTTTFGVYRGHIGTLPMLNQPRPLVTVTLLRDPAERAWSHYRFIRWRRQVPASGTEDYSFSDFLADPVWEEPGSNFQARWLALEPDARLYRAEAPNIANYDDPLIHRPPAWPGGRRLDDIELERRALRTLDACSLVGTVARLPVFVGCLERLLGRRLAPLMRLNVDPSPEEMPVTVGESVRRNSAVDLRLLRRADELLDLAQATLPALPPPPDPIGIAQLPLTLTMAGPLVGDNWHARVFTAEAGWHRWSGPGTASRIELPVRFGGRVRMEIDFLSACEPEVLQSLRLSVQGRAVHHRFVERRLGVTAAAEVALDASQDATITIDVSHTAHLRDASGGSSPDPAGVAVGYIRLLPPA